MQLAASVELGARGSGRSRDGQGRRALRRTVSLLLSKHGDLNAAATAAHQLSSHGERALMPQHLAIRFDRQAAAPFGSALQSPSAASRPGVIVITLLIVFRGNRCSRLTQRRCLQVRTTREAGEGDSTGLRCRHTTLCIATGCENSYKLGTRLFTKGT